VNVLKTASPTPVRPEVMFSDTRAECRTCGAHVRVGGRVGSVAAAWCSVCTSISLYDSDPVHAAA